MSERIATSDTLPPRRTRPRSKPVPAEGDGGLFTESWFPVCMSEEVPVGKVIGRTFLDGRIVIFRGDDGVAQVLSAYCPHLGADLAAGKVVGERIQCGFHHWEFGKSGWCEKTGIGDPPPKTACLYNFHTVERWGLVWGVQRCRSLVATAPTTRNRMPRSSSE
ncbi:MAG: Rieske 2Fe-2S domain-containing protein [Gammaproteobacteria bacterium]|nr:Rieske 2Fe-2S domain-containing protein [Gammaproteobacteria bacterium]